MQLFKKQRKAIILNQEEALQLSGIVELELQHIEADRAQRELKEKGKYEKRLEYLKKKLAR